MKSVKLRNVVGRIALAVLLSLGVMASTLSLAHAEWFHGQWGHWEWHHGARFFVVEPYPYGYYTSPPVVYASPPPPPVYYAPPPPPVVVGPSFGIVIGR